MDFFARQDEVKRKSRLFFCAFFPALLAAVAALYLVINLCLLAIVMLDWTGSIYRCGGFFSTCRQGGSYRVCHVNRINDQEFCREGRYKYALVFETAVNALPRTVYGSPPRVFSWRPALIIGSILTLIILTAARRKAAAIKEGGGPYVAGLLGGKRLTRPRTPGEKRLLDIAAEMAVAAGLPLPRIYLLRDEPSINAVTAGLNRHDAVIIVTGGALRHLDRQELQAVVAHEFGHILNGDYRLSLTMAGWLYGLLAFSITGREIIMKIFDPEAVRGNSANSRGGGAFYFIMVFSGAMMMLGGYLGHLAAAAVEAALARSREEMADALAVQFTRNPAALAGALKKIGGCSSQGLQRRGQALLVRSFFMNDPEGESGLLATHPPLERRILALEPGWNGVFPKVAAGVRNDAEPTEFKWRDNENQVKPDDRALAARLHELPPGWASAILLSLAAEDGAGLDQAYAELAGRGLAESARLLARWPRELRQTLEDPASTPALACAVFISSDPAVRAAQTAHVERLAGPRTAVEAVRLAQIMNIEIKLVALRLIAPALNELDDDQRRNLSATIKALMVQDGRLDIFEVAAGLALQKELGVRLWPENSEVRRGWSRGLEIIIRDLALVLSGLAHLGASTPAEAEGAFVAGAARIGKWMNHKLIPRERINALDLAKAIENLDLAPPAVKRSMVRAALICVLFDRVVTWPEYALLCALASAWGVPLPLPPEPDERPDLNPELEAYNRPGLTPAASGDSTARVAVAFMPFIAYCFWAAFNSQKANDFGMSLMMLTMAGSFGLYQIMEFLSPRKKSRSEQKEADEALLLARKFDHKIFGGALAFLFCIGGLLFLIKFVF